jgi:predicted  nucleic acid-binding Zn-ribbon protein
MPHQCLKCGQTFEKGSPQLLKGCSDCGGNRFFFTKKPLNEEERIIIANEVVKDLNSTIIEILGEENGKIVSKSDKWVTIKQKDIRRAIDHHLSEKEKTAIKKKETDATSDEKRKEILEKLDSEESDSPGTIDVEQSGRYNINLKGLLEEEPIIIQKDGSYNIHLPSVFKMLDKDKKIKK